ncbi:bifunctional precorrin-2 dehydrogenase/sirohydrochlorin ferrochelatase [Paenibacillus thermoaerophilus]|uniref:precorrin-2 dehydrogenase n=1 Tax=Paenibacillus thermoaerophilus TaxID=1215385 RepID=A0ABW2V345_9BACL|nr:bifunctional precorrin-2 dehydrogenase/sirohydrochlorin ferrochelatase [Paenibacillus thermoaerophilus]TMV11088.1 bifunctional precorrin-2 dehydrogenase/sirohydrochlorin ferrochelatase [Paenibacillus thermoaerophilus]
MMENGWVPVLLRLNGKRVVAIGGGPAAERKLAPLLEAGASVGIVSPKLTPGLRQAADEGRLDWQERRYRHGDLAQAELAVIATGVPSVDEAARLEAAERGAWVLDAAAGECGDLMLPAVARKGRLTLAVSTLGASPGVAARLARELADGLAGDWPEVLNALARIRDIVKRNVPAGDTRRRLLRAFDADAARWWLRTYGGDDASFARLEHETRTDPERLIAAIQDNPDGSGQR